MGYRLFLFEAEGTMRRIPQRIANGLYVGRSPLPEYAGKRLPYALVWLATDNRRPVAIRHIETGFFSFNEHGNPQEELAQGAMEALESYEDSKREKEQSGQVVSITARLARQQWERDHRWTPSPAEIDRIRTTIWPKKKDTA